MTVLLNGALVLFMVTWLGGSRSSRPVATVAIPMQVRPVEPEEMDLAEGPAAQLPAGPGEKIFSEFVSTWGVLL